MKNIYPALALCLISHTVPAQEGIIYYEETVKLNLQVEDTGNRLPELPKEEKIKKILYYSPTATLYESLKKDEEESSVEQMDDGRRINIKIDRPDEIFYYDANKKIMTEQREFLTRNFLVESEVHSSKWKLTGNQKTILGYACMEATQQDGEKSITAWYTPSIPVGSGPLYFAGLPGMILELDVNAGFVHVIATEVKQEVFDRKVLKKPTEGKKMTKEEFEQMRKEKIKEMNETNGGNNVIIRIKE